MAGFAGEGEEFFVVAVGAVLSGEAGDNVATAEVVLHVGDGLWAQGAQGGAMVFLVAGEEFIPGVVDELPEG